VNGATGEQIGSFYVDVNLVFNASEQFAKIQSQIRDFARTVSPIVIPVRLAPVTPAQVEMAAMGAEGMIFSSAGKRRSGGVWRDSKTGMSESELNAYYKKQGMVQGEGGWYRPQASVMPSMGMMGGMLGFAKANAAFMGVFAGVGDLMKGAQLDRQLAILHAIIPAQQQYNQSLQQVIQTANLTGSSVIDTAHGFVAFANAAKNAGVDMGTAAKTFKALNVGIAATGSGQQSYRIYSDFLSQVMNAQNIDLARIGRTDLGRYLDVIQLMQNLPMFKGDTVAQMQAQLDKLTKAQQMNVFATALLTAYQNQAAVGQNTLAGNFNQLQNSLELMASVIVSDLTPALNTLILGLKTIADIITFIMEQFQPIASAVQSNNNLTLSQGTNNLFGHHKSILTRAVGAMQLINSFPSMSSATAFSNPFNVHVTVQNQSSNPVRASATISNPHSGQQLARSQ